MPALTFPHLHCVRCDFAWYPMRAKKPQCCPRCKSYRYETLARKTKTALAPLPSVGDGRQL